MYHAGFSRILRWITGGTKQSEYPAPMKLRTTLFAFAISRSSASASTSESAGSVPTRCAAMEQERFARSARPCYADGAATCFPSRDGGRYAAAELCRGIIELNSRGRIH